VLLKQLMVFIPLKSLWNSQSIFVS